jgi:hypothetical protein
MASTRLGALAAVTALFSIAVADGAAAHISMTSPSPRFDDGDNKWCPCGTAGDGTSGPVTRPNNGCEMSAVDTERGGDVHTYAPGETIVVEWHETIGHKGRMRVAFDPDGADQNAFDDNVLVDLADPDGNTGNMEDGDRWCTEVELPTAPCDNCTLQLVQVMNGNDADEVTDVFGTDTYFQCANLVISGDAGGDPPRAQCKKGPGGGVGCGGCSGADAMAPGLAVLVALGLWRRAPTFRRGR